MSTSKKSLQIQKTYEALFALEDIREIFRQSLPAGFDEEEQEKFSGTVARIKSILADLENGSGLPARFADRAVLAGRTDPAESIALTRFRLETGEDTYEEPPRV